jgi:integrase
MTDMKIRVLPDDLKLTLTDPTLRLAVQVALVTALREREVLSLRLESFQGAAGRRVVPVLVKGGRVEDVYFPDQLVEAIQKFIRTRRRSLEVGWLFVGRRRRSASKLAVSTLWKLWHDAQRGSGVAPPLFRFHDLRHTAITRFYLLTRDIEKTRMFARHRSIATTQIYTHIRPEEVWKDMEGMNHEK